MKIVTFQGGLGNQMFQYQFYIWLKNNVQSTIYGYYPVKGLSGHNGLEIENCFDNVKLPKTNRFVIILVGILKFLNLIGFKFISTASSFSLNRILFEDYWQDLNYLGSTSYMFNTSRLDHNFRNLEILEKINSTNSISIHIRRGDYVSDKYANIYGGICDLAYYDRAIKYILSKVEKPSFFVFSDDFEWAKNNLDISNATFIEWNLHKNSYIDMFLMNQCKHNIIANSTFSWWGAYNSSNFRDGIVISPTKWFASNSFTEPLIFPKQWIRL
jgi:hypothetical protein